MEDVSIYRVYGLIVSQWICTASRDMSTYLLEANSVGLLAEALTAEVKAVLADETSLVGAVAAAKGRGTSALCRARAFQPGPGRGADIHHWREPLPYLRGRENQTASWVILSGFSG